MSGYALAFILGYWIGRSVEAVVLLTLTALSKRKGV